MRREREEGRDRDRDAIDGGAERQKRGETDRRTDRRPLLNSLPEIVTYKL